MRQVAFIAEFNPPHLGHAYFIEQIRKKFGEDTCIIAIMSGNYVQRGMPAVLDAYTRAEMALNIGVDLVLELPFPYSASTAERFATAGVSIATNLGSIEYLCFGSESGYIDDLKIIADYLNSSNYETDLYEARKVDKTEGFAFVRQKAVAKQLGDELADLLRHPNNILAIEYIRAIDGLFSDLKPFTIRRRGSYHNTSQEQVDFPSSSLIRRLISEQECNFAEYMGKENADILIRHMRDKDYMIDAEVLFRPMIMMFLREHVLSRTSLPPDCPRDLYVRFLKAAKESTDMDSFLEAVKAKHETDAYIRRALLYLFMGVPNTAFLCPPAYTRVLAANARGREALGLMKKTSKISILTKTADYKKSTLFDMKSQSELAIFAEQVYNLCIKEPRTAAEAVKKAPIIKD